MCDYRLNKVKWIWINENKKKSAVRTIFSNNNERRIDEISMPAPILNLYIMCLCLMVINQELVHQVVFWAHGALDCCLCST